MKTILFISSVNLSLNPRILKEIKLALREGMNVSFLGFKMGNWSDDTEREILKNLPDLKTFYLSATRRPFMPWLLASVAQKISGKLYSLISKSVVINVTACSKRSISIYLETKRLIKANKYDFVIAHTLPALSVAYYIHRKQRIPFGFDVEDYHPGEFIESDVQNEKRRRFFLMQHFLPSASYVSAASPIIAAEVSKLVGNRRVISVPNFFSKGEFEQPADLFSEKIRLVWFSQNINYGRGLELVLPILDERFELTIIGKLDTYFYESYIGPNKAKYKIDIIEPMSQINLHKSLARFDIGLALDVSAADFNREMALTNKIISYFQSGLYILATNTQAQSLFLSEHQGHGLVCDQTAESLRQGLDSIAREIKSIRQEKLNRFESARHHNWEVLESEVLKLWSVR